MADRMGLAEEYVREQLQKRDDIVGALVVGSVARGDADDASDVDLVLIVEGDGVEEWRQGGTATWRDGVYIEATLAPKALYVDPGKVLRHRVAATHVHDALILYDPTGMFTHVQGEVRSAFMEPQYVGARVHPVVESLRGSVSQLNTAVASDDVLAVCQQEGRISFWLPSLPLLVEGITPSRTKALIQLETIWPDLKERICEWQGSSELSAGTVRAMLSTIPKCVALEDAASSEAWGEADRYIAEKAMWLVDNGWHQEAVHLAWFFVGVLAACARNREDAGLASNAENLVRDWLHAVGWEGQEVLGQKARAAESMLAEVAAMAADLPTG